MAGLKIKDQIQIFQEAFLGSRPRNRATSTWLIPTGYDFCVPWRPGSWQCICRALQNMDAWMDLAMSFLMVVFLGAGDPLLHPFLVTFQITKPLGLLELVCAFPQVCRWFDPNCYPLSSDSVLILKALQWPLPQLQRSEQIIIMCEKGMLQQK